MTQERLEAYLKYKDKLKSFLLLLLCFMSCPSVTFIRCLEFLRCYCESEWSVKHTVLFVLRGGSIMSHEYSPCCEGKCENPRTLSALIPEWWGSWKDVLLGDWLFGPNIRGLLGSSFGFSICPTLWPRGSRCLQNLLNPCSFSFLGPFINNKSSTCA